MYKWKLLFMLILSVSLLSACGENQSPQGGDASSSKGSEAQPQNQEPVKLVLWDNFAADTEDYTNTMYVQPVKKKYPNIDVEVITGKTKKIEDMVVNGDQVDLVVDNVIRTDRIEELGLNYDLSEMIKQNNFDLKRLEKPTLDMIQSFNSTKKLIGIPYKGGFMALYYNKDLFDKFGVPYPKDGMTWDQVLDLAKKMSRTQDGVNYIGFDPGLPEVASPLTADYIDPKTGKANLSTPEWKQGFDLFTRLISIPGNRKNDNGDHSGLPDFQKTQNVAMTTSQNILITLWQTPDFNWDMVTFPTYSGKPVAGSGSARGMYLTSTSKHKDAAFKVIESTTSDEAQITLAKNCGMPEVKSKDTEQNICMDFDAKHSKNYKAAFQFTPLWPKNPTEYDQTANGILGKHSKDLYKGVDINTVIRETEEEINQKVAEMKSK